MESLKPKSSADMSKMRRSFEDALFDILFYVSPIFFSEVCIYFDFDAALNEKN